jgi:cytochrome oxidase assembly protein ShyY1
VYRFLLTPRWLAGAALAVAAAVTMVFLGIWQLHRYHERSAINDRIDAADSTPAVPLTGLLTRPSAPSAAGPAPGQDAAWTKITVTGRYDPAHEIQVRARTVGGDVGFEIVTPLVLADGTAVLIDRGWIPPSDGGAIAAPTVPAAPGGDITVIGQIHLSESRPTPIAHRDGRLDTRRISVPQLAREMPYPVYGAYVLQTRPTDPAFTPIPIDHEDAWQNGGYTVQWWLFAAMALYAFVWQARKEAQGESQPASPGPADPALVGVSAAATSGRRRPKPTGDRVEEADRRAAAEAARLAGATGDRADSTDRKAASAPGASPPQPPAAP